jgi:hypothetical protein
MYYNNASYSALNLQNSKTADFFPMRLLTMEADTPYYKGSFNRCPSNN